MPNPRNLSEVLLISDFVSSPYPGRNSLNFCVFLWYIPTSISRQNTTYMTQRTTIPRMILYSRGLPKYATCILKSFPAIGVLAPAHAFCYISLYTRRARSVTPRRSVPACMCIMRHAKSAVHTSQQQRRRTRVIVLLF